MKSIKDISRGKVNLFLKITGLRPDGYHTLESVFQQVELGDSVSLISHRRGGISMRTNKFFLPVDSRNLAVRAAQLFFDKMGAANPGLYINIKKRLPVGGGMAGGSTNAAAVLSLLNKMHRSPFSGTELEEMSLVLGADVPFCVRGGAAAARGIGEELESLPSMPHCWLVLCRPTVSVSTKAAYQLYDEWQGAKTAPGLGAMKSAMEAASLEDVCAALHNDFEGPVFHRWPEIGKIKEMHIANGAKGALMTGTGSVVFGIYDDKSTAARAADTMRKHYREVFLTAPYGK